MIRDEPVWRNSHAMLAQGLAAVSRFVNEGLCRLCMVVALRITWEGLNLSTWERLGPGRCS